MKILAAIHDLMFSSKVNAAAQGRKISWLPRGTKVVEQVALEKPDVLLIDLAAPALDAVNAIAALKASEATKQLVVIGYVDHTPGRGDGRGPRGRLRSGAEQGRVRAPAARAARRPRQLVHLPGTSFRLRYVACWRDLRSPCRASSPSLPPLSAGLPAGPRPGRYEPWGGSTSLTPARER